MFLNLMNFGFEKKKLDKIEAVAQELERGYKGGGGGSVTWNSTPCFCRQWSLSWG